VLAILVPLQPKGSFIKPKNPTTEETVMGDFVAAIPRLRDRQMVRQLTDKAATTSN
jgi:hypothetical protein